ncbi:MAG: TonB-dependent receptor plug domain-containing protein [Verrucomicrobia bacterium]|nr:TonB-dependent receptor plug domain-containing protein [Verrucomicrobiota bacterium]
MTEAIFRPAAPAAEAPAPAGAGTPKDTTVLSIFEVRADKDEGYRSTTTTSGFNSLTTIRNTPGSISVMNRELIDDLIAVDVAEISKFGITGEVGTATEGQSGGMAGGGAHVFRGIVANIQLRNGSNWQTPLDSYNLDRVELLRGPNAFLNGEGQAGGMLNQITKQAVLSHDFQKINLLFGSDNFFRSEFDINRRLHSKFAVRAVAVFHEQDSFRNHANRNFKAVYFSANYQPFKTTSIKLDLETQRNISTSLGAIHADAFSTTDRTGATTLITNTIGGWTYVPGNGMVYDSVGLRRSSGTNILLPFQFGQAIMPRRWNIQGPDSIFNFQNKALALNVDQKVGENLNLNANVNLNDTFRQLTARGGSSAAGIYRDVNPTLPSGRPNPYYNELYTEHYWQSIRSHIGEPKANFKLAAVYDLKLPFMTQRILVKGTYFRDNPSPNNGHAEAVDYNGPLWKGGAFDPASTQAAHNANNLIRNQNHFYRRLYLRDGDSNAYTNAEPIPGSDRTGPRLDRGYMRNAQDGAGGRAISRIFSITSYGAGMSGSYLKDRLHTLAGWRRDGVDQNLHRDFYNYVRKDVFAQPGLVQASADVSKFEENSQDSINYGAVLNAVPFVSMYYNYAQSVAISSGIGAGTLFDNTIRGVPTGDGDEFGLRWSFFGDRLESNWTKYRSNVLRSSITASLLARTELQGIFPEVNLNGSDTQATKAEGVEFETIANLTKNWRLIWNYSTNKLALSQRVPLTKKYRDAAKAKNSPTPETDAYLLTVPEGVPVTGFTKARSNLVTNYRFSEGFLKNVSVGGGMQYRKKSYLGNFDLDRNGTAEELYSPGYFLGNLSFGYRTQLWKRKVDMNLVISNVFDKYYYRAFALGAGAWGEPRSFRFAIRSDL